MAEPKFKQMFDLMIKQNQELFDSFKVTHDKFMENSKEWKEKFNSQGRDVQDVIRIYENRLCGQSESSGYSKYSTNLAEKFQWEVKRLFPKIDFVGME
jgi:hypothetical protein